MNNINSKRTIVLTYKVQKIITVEIADFTLTNEELEAELDRLLSENAPDFSDILDSDYEWFGDNREPRTKGCEPIPPAGCWVEIDGREWATNGWCIVSREAPAIEDDYCIPAWHLATSELQAKIREAIVCKNKMRQRHPGYFSQRFVNFARIPQIEVYGDKFSSGYCWVGDRLIAIIMPLGDAKWGFNSEYFTFNQD